MVTNEGEPLLFSAPIFGNPIPDVEWEKDGEKLESSDRVRITCDGNKVCMQLINMEFMLIFFFL